jgi:drug/metabolite transporter superfamily protein YnfA
MSLSSTRGSQLAAEGALVVVVAIVWQTEIKNKNNNEVRLVGD